jgi:hypothetical protein
MIIGTDAILRLSDFLKEEEAIPVKDEAGIITAAGIDAHVRTDTIRACIRRITDERHTPEP